MRTQLQKRNVVKTTFFLLVIGLCAFPLSAAAEKVTVFAAASTTNALTDIAGFYMQQDVDKVVTSFASSSTLAKQIENGAPADVFLSANTQWVDYLEQRRLLEKGSQVNLLSNRIVLIVPMASPIKDIDVKPHFHLAEALADGRLAMGDPDYVPAGIYGKKALQHLGVWEQVASKLAPMKDVRAALVLVERGEAPLGQVYATDAAISQKVRVVGTFPADSHPTIAYPVAIIAGHKRPAVDRFMTYLTSDTSRAVFQRYGFAVR